VKLDRILANLVDNAVKYTPAGGQVRTEARRASDGRAEFLVTDTGIGIPFDQQQRIFDEFHQLRNPERDRNKGTGLGLAICQRIAEAMGARLSVKSTPGQGSTFTLTLPAARCIPAPPDSAPSSLRSLGQTGDGQVADKTQPRPVAAPTLPLSGLRVLLIEDHNTTRRATAELLSHQGALVIEAPNGRTGLAMLQDSRLLPPQALLLDMILPDIDGTEVLRLLHASRPPGLQRVLVLTGDMTDDRIQQVRQLGADALIPKPVDMAALIAALRPAANGTSAAPA
jgi:CheY-like chemotaxis protein/anti-sigma regulatory factor (Ser/Thr protein kinase)